MAQKPPKGKHMPYNTEDYKLGKKWDREREGTPKPEKQPPRHKKR